MKFNKLFKNNKIFPIIIFFCFVLILFIFTPLSVKKKFYTEFLILKQDTFAALIKILPDKVQYVINIYNTRGNTKSLRSFENDYNVKFLPETQFLTINLKSKKLKKLDALSSKFFLERYDDSIWIIDQYGRIYKSPKNINLKTSQIFKNLQSNINWKVDYSEILDALIHDNYIYLSAFYLKNGCNKFIVFRSRIENYLNFSKFFAPEECSIQNIGGGRMKAFTKNNFEDGVLITVSEYEQNDPNNNAQNDNSIFGKIIFVNFNKEYEIYSKGHRNVQGLLIDKNNIISTEHGPKGGDEINKIEYNKNYGWPIASYGERYDKKFLKKHKTYLKSHIDNNFTEPIYSFVPSIGISEIIKIPNSFSKKWQDNYLLSSLNGKSLYRMKFSDKFERIIYLEKIFVGKRIRDLIYDETQNVFLLSFQGKYPEIGILDNLN